MGHPVYSIQKTKFISDLNSFNIFHYKSQNMALLLSCLVHNLKAHITDLETNKNVDVLFSVHYFLFL